MPGLEIELLLIFQFLTLPGWLKGGIVFTRNFHLSWSLIWSCLSRPLLSIGHWKLQLLIHPSVCGLGSVFGSVTVWAHSRPHTCHACSGPLHFISSGRSFMFPSRSLFLVAKDRLYVATEERQEQFGDRPSYTDISVRLPTHGDENG